MPRSDFRAFGGEPTPVYTQYAACTWMIGTYPTIVFPIVRLIETGGARLVERKRPYRPGAKLDDTGREAYKWKLTAVFDNSITEEGLEANGAALYPDVLNRLLETVGVGECGTLTLPTRGPMAARFAAYSRVEEAEARDFVIVEMDFWEDNEDKISIEHYAAPRIQASGQTMIEEAIFSAQSEGSWSGSLEDLTELVRGIEGYASAPDDYKRDLEAQANTIMQLHQRVVAANQKVAVTGRDAFLYPSSHKAQRDLATLAEMCAQERQATRRSMTSIVCGKNQTLADVAIMVGQPIETLLEINLQLEDPFWIEAGTVVRVPNAGA